MYNQYMDVKKCQRCGKGILIKVPIPAPLIKRDAKNTDPDKTGWRCNSCGSWSFE